MSETTPVERLKNEETRLKGELAKAGTDNKRSRLQARLRVNAQRQARELARQAQQRSPRQGGTVGPVLPLSPADHA